MKWMLEETYKYIVEEENEDRTISREIDRLSKQQLDDATIQNAFTNRPQGVLVQDSYNNPFYPIYPTPKIDSYKPDILELYKKFRELYSNKKSVYLPWHYVIEMVDKRYIIMNTRPTHLKFPITTTDFLSSIENKEKINENFNDPTQLFLKEKPFDISEAIHVCILGDSYTDVYMNRMYKTLVETCIQPVRRYHRIKGLFNSIYVLNVSTRFDSNKILNYLK